MSTLKDIAFFLYNCDKSTLLIVSGSDTSGKRLLLDAIRSCIGSDIETHYEEEGYNPSPSFEGACRIMVTSHQSPVVDSTFPWVRNIGFISIDQNTVGSFPSVRRLTAALRDEMEQVTDDD